tara:strand:+ start:241 stop:441 length:201 start_codon:yes stop_codon:yes gene_type:complete
MKQKPILYRVYTKKGEYHHGYSAKLEGSRNWAIDCAKTVRGRVTEVYDDENKTEESIFDFNKKAKK